MDDKSGSPVISPRHHSHSAHFNYHHHHQNLQHQVNHISESSHCYARPNRIAELQEEYLIPMKEDLSDWLKAILDIDDLDANNFMTRLDNGVIVCKLAKLIEERCDIDETKLASLDSSNNNNNNTKYNYIKNNNFDDNQKIIINNNDNLNNNNDHKANANNNTNNILNSINSRSNNPKSPSHNDQGQYRSHSVITCGRRLSFNYGGSPINGPSSPSSTISSSSLSNGICARTMKCWENAKSETFYARDNVSNFIKWCRKLNVRECVLFESEDLVLHNNPKNVVLCLLEVARIACKKFSFTPAPGLVQFEQEIDAEEKAELEREMVRRRKRQQLMASKKLQNGKTSTNNNVTSDKSDTSKCNNSTYSDAVMLKSDLKDNDELESDSDKNNNIGNDNLILGYVDEEDNNDNNHTNGDNGNNNLDKCSERPDSDDMTGGQSSDTGSINTGDDGVDGWSSVSQENLGRTLSVTSISSTSAESTEASSQAPFGQESEKVVSQLDQKVMLIAKSYYGKKAKHGIQRIAEGKYRIAGKIVFVRLLKDRHVMVRVGGGWDTLQHFLERHGNGSDPVKEISPSDLLPMDTRPSESMSRRRNSQSSQQSIPSTPILRRCLSSTPVSRSSVSSPEPWSSVGSSACSVSGSPSSSSGYNGLVNGYSPYGHRSLARRSSACTTLSNITTASSSTTHSSTSSSSSTLNSTEKCVSPVVPTTTTTNNNNNNANANINATRNLPNSQSVNRRRSLVNDGITNHRNTNGTIKPNRSMLSLNLTRSPSTSSHLNSSSFSSRHFNASSGNLNNMINSNNNNNNSPIIKTSRYPNYLQSSQHITSRSSISHHVKSIVTPTSPSSPSTSTTPTNTSPTSGAAPLRRTSLKAF